ncbi:RdRP-domain-containing protein [Abortiporus biennis]|nr:RdRP-domain-containing protein [Abortiporus biennis]
MEFEVTRFPRESTIYDIKKEIATFLHSDFFYNRSDTKARKINFEIKFNEGVHGMRHNGTAVLTLPTTEIGEKFMRILFGRRQSIVVNGRKIFFRPTGREPDNKLRNSLNRTLFLDPGVEEQRERILERLNSLIHISSTQIGVFYRNDDDLPNTPRSFSIEYETHTARMWFEYNRKLIRIQLGEPIRDQDAYNIVIAFSNIRRLATGYDGVVSYVCAELLTPPIFQLEKFNRSFTGNNYQDSRKYRKRISSLNAYHADVAPFAYQLRLIFFDEANRREFGRLCEVAGLPRLHTKGIIKASRDQPFYTLEVQEHIQSILLQLDWSIAFQVEALLRNGLVNSRDLLGGLLDSISQLCNDEPATAADKLRLFTEAVRTKSRTQSVIACFDEVRQREVEESQKGIESDPGTFLCHHVIVTPSRILLEGPYAMQSNRIIRAYADYQEHFIRVEFRDEDRLQYRWEVDVDGLPLLHNHIGGILKNGLEVAGRRFEFLAYSNSALRQHSVWFVSPFTTPSEGLVNAEVIRSSLGNFTDLLKYPSKYAARIAQALTATDPSVSIARDQWEEMDDLGKKPYLFTDGVGTISKELGDKIWAALCSARRDEHQKKRVQPSAYQIRFLGYKGMVAVDDQLEGIKMRLRPSMRKFEAKQDGPANIEIARPFDHPVLAYLNRPLVSILEDRGVEISAFLTLQNLAVGDVHMASDTIEQARHLLRSHKLGESFRMDYLLECSIAIGVRNFLDDVFIARLIEIAKTTILRDIKNSARIRVPGSYQLVGIADEGPAYEAAGYKNVYSLPEGHIFACIQRKPNEEPEYVSGAVSISRSPTLHPGDVQRVWAIGKPPKNKLCLFRNIKNAVVLPSVGERSLCSMLGGGDLDGDEYLIIKDGTLLPIEHVDAGVYPDISPRQIDRDCTIEDVCDFVVEYIHSDVVGLLADRHLIIADQSTVGTRDEKCLQLAELCSQAVDYQKRGIPVDMEKSPRRLIPYKPDWKQADETVLNADDYYISTRALGELFRSIKIPEKPQQIVSNTSNSLLAHAMTPKIKNYIKPHLPHWRPSKEQFSMIKKVFESYVHELKYISLTHSLTDSPDDKLEEEEIVLGTILANCTQHRYRKDRTYRMRVHAAVIVGGVQNKLYRQPVDHEPSEDDLKNGLCKAWLAWDFGMRNRERFGANSFALIALGVIFTLLESLGDIKLNPESR